MSLALSGLISGASNMSCSCSISSMMRSTSMRHNHLRPESNAVKSVIEKFREKYGAKDVKEVLFKIRCGGCGGNDLNWNVRIAEERIPMAQEQ
jgi:hypothetical protein